MKALKKKKNFGMRLERLHDSRPFLIWRFGAPVWWRTSRMPRILAS